MEFQLEKVNCEMGDIEPIKDSINLIKEDLELIYNKVVYKDIDIISVAGASGWGYQTYIVKVLYEVE